MEKRFNREYRRVANLCGNTVRSHTMRACSQHDKYCALASGISAYSRTLSPMAWRSWNAFLAKIDDELIRANIDALVEKTKSGVSLWDVGFKSIGIDEGWEGCGMGVNHTQHYRNGTPAVNRKFPDMPSLVEYGHGQKDSVRMGFYQNGCACGEHQELLINYQGDVNALVDFGPFDSVKLDGCGRQKNMSLYAALMNASGRSYEVENCHWGVVTKDDTSSAPTADWCPFNLFRTSGDIRQTWASWTRNLRTALPYLDKNAPISQPSCWAYPECGAHFSIATSIITPRY